MELAVSSDPSKYRKQADKIIYHPFTGVLGVLKYIILRRDNWDNLLWISDDTFTEALGGASHGVDWTLGKTFLTLLFL